MTPEEKRAARLAELQAQLEHLAADAAIAALPVGQLSAAVSIITEVLTLTVLAPAPAPAPAAH